MLPNYKKKLINMELKILLNFPRPNQIFKTFEYRKFSLKKKTNKLSIANIEININELFFVPGFLEFKYSFFNLPFHIKYRIDFINSFTMFGIKDWIKQFGF